MNGVVIDVDSRENPPVRNIRAPKSRTRSQRTISVEDVIVLTDSDSEGIRAGSSQRRGSVGSSQLRKKTKKGKTRAAAEFTAGPSRPPNDAPAQAPAPVLAPAPAPMSVPVPAPALVPIPPFAQGPAYVPPPPAAVPLFLPDPHADLVPAPMAPQVPVLAAANPEDLAPVPVPPEIPPEPAAVQGDDIPYDACVAHVLEIIPDVLPAHVFSLIEQHYPNHKEKVVEAVLHILFENLDYPKVDSQGKGKRKREDVEQELRVVKPKVDYGDKNREVQRSMHYGGLALEQLESDFVDIPAVHIRQTFKSHKLLYAPTYLALREERQQQPLPYKAMTRLRNKGKGKGVQKHDEELQREILWIQEQLDNEAAQRVAEATEEMRLQEEGGIECGCCFSEYTFDKMVQCPEAHLFCTTCMVSYAETKLGEHDARIVCMDQSGCKLQFPDSELRRFLTPKLLELYERVKQQKEIEAAGLEGLEECPFCEYKVVIENEQERLFRCENEACGAVTCRNCKKLDHLPKSCQEVDDDKKLDARHVIEEAMTRALMRNCPKCQKAFIKELGCNKMTCPNCATLSCYICRQVITGYDHFANPPGYAGKPNRQKCALWDASVEGRHSDEVTAAAKKAMEEYKRAHPDVDEKDIAVDLPVPVAGTGAASQGAHVHHMHLPAMLFQHRHAPDAGPAGGAGAGAALAVARQIEVANNVRRNQRRHDQMLRAQAAQRVAAEAHRVQRAQIEVRAAMYNVMAMGPAQAPVNQLHQHAQAGPAYVDPAPAPALVPVHLPAHVHAQPVAAARPRRSVRVRYRR